MNSVAADGVKRASIVQHGADAPIRLAIVVSHPIQYLSPWFQHLAALPSMEIRVFYLWDFGVRAQRDRDFGESFAWDIPLLEGYSHEFVPNRSSDPGTHHFRGLDNPQLVQRLCAWKPSVILLFGYAYLSHCRLMLSPALRRLPLVLRGDSHNIGRPQGLRPLFTRLLRRLLFKRIAAFMAVGTANTSYLRESGAAPRTIFFAPHFVDNDRFRRDGERHSLPQSQAWRRELGIKVEDVVFLFAGKLEPRKAPLDLLEAWRLALPRASARGLRRPVLLYVGSGTLADSLRAHAKDNLNDGVFFAPFQNQCRMPQVYAAADVLVLPSTSETWGLCVNEAMSVGRPAIVSSHVGCGPDLIVPGETGWVFPAGDVAALSEVMLMVLAKRDQLREMGQAAQRHVARYSCQEATHGLLAAVYAVVGARRRTLSA